jgi:adenylate cyclase
MTSQQKFGIVIFTLLSVSIYLFASAPTELSDTVNGNGRLIPIELVLRLVAAENDVARTLYTSEIVGAGKNAGLAFSESWRDQGVDAGPLPALFLRETSANIQRTSLKLGLFLGSEFPIAISNRFSDLQMEKFNRIKQSNEAQVFLDTDTNLYTAMFPDYASVAPCVTCHNDHNDSPKIDWELGDIMGATTWTYPKEKVTIDEALLILSTLRNGFAGTYTTYLEKVSGFDNPPEIGENWPRDGYYLPTVDIFLAEFTKRASPNSIEMLLSIADERVSSP